MMKVYLPPPPLKRPRCSICLPVTRKKRRLEYDLHESDDDAADSALSDHDDSSDSDSDSECDFEDDGYRQVRFSTTTTSFQASHYRATKDNWWSRQDRQEFIADCHESVQDLQEENHAVFDHYSAALKQAHEDPSHHSSDSYPENSTLCIPTELRGLEWGLSKDGKRYSKSIARRAHVSTVLELQKATKHLNHRMRERLLSNRSVQMSRPSCIMARLLAEGDATGSKPDETQKRRIGPQRRVTCTMLPSTKNLSW